MKKVKPIFRRVGRILFLLLLMVSTFSYAMFQGGFVSWFLFYSLIPFLIYSLILAIYPINIQNVEREITPIKLERGDTGRVTVRFENKTWFPIIFLTVSEVGMDKHFYDHSNGQASNIFFVGLKRKFEWTYELHHLNRGQVVFHGLQFTISDLFGWSVRHKVIEAKAHFTVYPKMIDVKYQPIQMQFDQGGVASAISIVKDTSMVTGVRDYQAGDRFSWIHWKSFAKNETLRTKEFEDRQSQHIFLCMDRTIQNGFEDIVDLTASILQSVVKNQGDISLLSYGHKRSFFPNIKTQSHFQKSLQHLAVVKPDATQVITAILMKELKNLSSSTLLLITANLSDDLAKFFANSSNIMRGVICIAITDEKSEIRKTNYPNVKIIPISKAKFQNVFTEVMKP